ncbi:MAG: hypothetical protein RLZ45_132 [Verrucomicrobiota bacterium]
MNPQRINNLALANGCLNHNVATATPSWPHQGRTTAGWANLVGILLAMFSLITTVRAASVIEVDGVQNGQPSPVLIGPATVGSPQPQRTFVIRNRGNTPLTIGAMTLPPGFVLSKGPARTVAPGKETSFTVGLMTAKAGTPSGTVSIPNNDPKRNPFRFPIKGIVQALAGRPEVSVFVNGIPYMANGYQDFRTYVNRGYNSGKFIVLTIRNEGSADLTLSQWSLAQGFVATPTVPTTLRPGASVVVTIRPSENVLPLRTGSLSFRTNDADEPVFNIGLRGIVFEPIQRNQLQRAISTFPSGQVTIYSQANWRYSIEPANAGMSWNGAFVIRSYDSLGRLMTRLDYDSNLGRVVIYRRGPVAVDNWASDNVVVELR